VFRRAIDPAPTDFAANVSNFQPRDSSSVTEATDLLRLVAKSYVIETSRKGTPNRGGEGSSSGGPVSVRRRPRPPPTTRWRVSLWVKRAGESDGSRAMHGHLRRAVLLLCIGAGSKRGFLRLLTAARREFRSFWRAGAIRVGGETGALTAPRFAADAVFSLLLCGSMRSIANAQPLRSIGTCVWLLRHSCIPPLLPVSDSVLWRF
jgi:hypothetical protein